MYYRYLFKLKKGPTRAAPCKEIRIRESGKLFPLESGIRNAESFACGIRKTAQEIRNPTNEWNPESKLY